ncbi:hypothetical protein V8J82_04455 [Gymnodinialimonas sp. 2305UL16-5]|uniref:hypothetical protein n=1 Tax=Gymnodinialimonas mytili TaxID=3126503 RepID=UPI0030949926
MTILRIAPALALPVALLMGAPASATTSCSAGQYAADALVVPLEDFGTITEAVQLAWDGVDSITPVCDLLTDTDFHNTWSLFSGEVDEDHPGICIVLMNEAGEEWVSCQTPTAVNAAFAAEPGDDAAILVFETWEESESNQ